MKLPKPVEELLAVDKPVTPMDEPLEPAYKLVEELLAVEVPPTVVEAPHRAEVPGDEPVEPVNKPVRHLPWWWNSWGSLSGNPRQPSGQCRGS